MISVCVIGKSVAGALSPTKTIDLFIRSWRLILLTWPTGLHSIQVKILGRWLVCNNYSYRKQIVDSCYPQIVDFWLLSSRQFSPNCLSPSKELLPWGNSAPNQLLNLCNFFLHVVLPHPQNDAHNSYVMRGAPKLSLVVCDERERAFAAFEAFAIS